MNDDVTSIDALDFDTPDTE
jgi:hypothetical protein